MTKLILDHWYHIAVYKCNSRRTYQVGAVVRVIAYYSTCLVYNSHAHWSLPHKSIKFLMWTAYCLCVSGSSEHTSFSSFLYLLSACPFQSPLGRLCNIQLEDPRSAGISPAAAGRAEPGCQVKRYLLHFKLKKLLPLRAVWRISAYLKCTSNHYGQ